MKYLLILLLFCGCTVMWTDDAYYCSLLTWKQADAITYDSNSINIKAINYLSDPEQITAVTPYGTIQTRD